MEEKIIMTDENGETVEFYVLEETRIHGKNYLLVTDAEEEDDCCCDDEDCCCEEEDCSIDYELTCPNCGAVTVVDEDTLLNEQVCCGNCGAEFEIEFGECDCGDECDCEDCAEEVEE